MSRELVRLLERAERDQRDSGSLAVADEIETLLVGPPKDALKAAYDDGRSDGYDVGREEGYDAGHDEGYEAGYEKATGMAP